KALACWRLSSSFSHLINLLEIKFLGLKFDSKLSFAPMVDEIKQRSSSRLNLIKIFDRYVAGGLRHSVPWVIKLVDEYKAGFESRYAEYSTTLFNCYLTISSFFPELFNT
ncbi:hypothetical protein BpHYR1_023631, partial [Brachionus plicatilis]